MVECYAYYLQHNVYPAVFFLLPILVDRFYDAGQGVGQQHNDRLSGSAGQ